MGKTQVAMPGKSRNRKKQSARTKIPVAERTEKEDLELALRLSAETQQPAASLSNLEEDIIAEVIKASIISYEQEGATSEGASSPGASSSTTFQNTSVQSHA